MRHVGGVRDLVEALRDVLALRAHRGGEHEQAEDDGGDEGRRGGGRAPGGAYVPVLDTGATNAPAGVKFSLGDR